MLSEKSSPPQVNLVIPSVVNRLISLRELRAVAIKHLVELSILKGKNLLTPWEQILTFWN